MQRSPSLRRDGDLGFTPLADLFLFFVGLENGERLTALAFPLPLEVSKKFSF